jgi:hypothetical protein
LYPIAAQQSRRKPSRGSPSNLMPGTR